VISDGLVERLKGCRSVILLYWKAKRMVDEQSSDITKLINNIKSRLGINEVRASTFCEACESFDCIAVLSVLPGRLTARALRFGSRLRVPFLMDAIKDRLMVWLINEMSRTGGQGFHVKAK
jgi:hypothetical protein